MHRQTYATTSNGWHSFTCQVCWKDYNHEIAAAQERQPGLNSGTTILFGLSASAPLRALARTAGAPLWGIFIFRLLTPTTLFISLPEPRQTFRHFRILKYQSSAFHSKGS